MFWIRFNQYLTSESEATGNRTVYVLHVVRYMMAGPVSVIVVASSSSSLTVLLGHPLLDNPSDHASGLSSIDEDIHIAECDTILEVQLLLRDSSALVLDVFLFAMSHDTYLVFNFTSIVYVLVINTPVPVSVR